MNDDYLWDRSGEPDPEIEQLEQVLGTLRYQPRPLELPVHVRIVQCRAFLPRIAVAAAVALMLAGGAAWLILQNPNAPASLGASSNLSSVERSNTPSENAVVP